MTKILKKALNGEIAKKYSNNNVDRRKRGLKMKEALKFKELLIKKAKREKPENIIDFINGTYRIFEGKSQVKQITEAEFKQLFLTERPTKIAEMFNISLAYVYCLAKKFEIKRPKLQSVTKPSKIQFV